MKGGTPPAGSTHADTAKAQPVQAKITPPNTAQLDTTPQKQMQNKTGLGDRIRESRTISRPLKNIPFQAGALQHSAKLHRLNNGECYVQERLGGKGRTDDYVERKVIIREQVMVTNFDPLDSHLPRVFEGFGEDIPIRICPMPKHFATDLGCPIPKLPEVTIKHPEHWHTDPDKPPGNHSGDYVSIKIEDVATGKREIWTSPIVADRSLRGKQFKKHGRESAEYVKSRPYSVENFNCHDFVRHSDAIAGVENPTRHVGDVIMYQVADLVFATSLPASEGSLRQLEQNELSRLTKNPICERLASIREKVRRGDPHALSLQELLGQGDPPTRIIPRSLDSPPGDAIQISSILGSFSLPGAEPLPFTLNTALQDIQPLDAPRASSFRSGASSPTSLQSEGSSTSVPFTVPDPPGSSAAAAFSAANLKPERGTQANKDGYHFESRKVKVSKKVDVGAEVTVGGTMGAVACGGVFGVASGSFTLSVGFSTTGPYLVLGCANPLVGIAILGGVAGAVLVSCAVDVAVSRHKAKRTNRGGNDAQP